MEEARNRNLKKNAMYCAEGDQARLLEETRVFSFENEMPWFCTAKRVLVAKVRPQMMILYNPKGDYRIAYTQDLDPQLHRMRWTGRFTAFDAGNNELFELFVDTRELTVHPGTKSWAYQIHTGVDLNIARHFDKVASWGRDLTGNGWFRDE
ncbi:MAG: hypothetical protein GY854_05915 [Deltaproteobacteria bacterium]|nr:hypothetical protein [Deltaproteobacteria bacterium]